MMTNEALSEVWSLHWGVHHGGGSRAGDIDEELFCVAIGRWCS
jgi:hypothetical protein